MGLMTRILQLGDSTITTRLTPVAVSGFGSGVVNVAVGWVRLCFEACIHVLFFVATVFAVLRDGDVVCVAFGVLGVCLVCSFRGWGCGLLPHSVVVFCGIMMRGLGGSHA